MDADLLRRAAGRVVVTALAGAPGSDYATATANGVRHFRALGAGEVVGAPDARDDAAAALAVVATARLLVLPGGSPLRLLEALTGSGMDVVLRALLADGALVMGASAGAMVLCPWTALPDKRTAGGLAVEPGLGCTPEVVVVPHWSGGSSRGDWLRAIEAAVPPSTSVLGIPEESGVLIEGRVLTAVGMAATRVLPEGRDLAPGESWRLP
jgi:cyanophycinase-like exopeptidase